MYRSSIAVVGFQPRPFKFPSLLSSETLNSSLRRNLRVLSLATMHSTLWLYPRWNLLLPGNLVVCMPPADLVVCIAAQSGCLSRGANLVLYRSPLY
jgi:hypothetical protein